MNVLHVFVDGMPKAQPRCRRSRNGGVYTPHSSDAWKRNIAVAVCGWRHLPLNEPLGLSLEFSLPRPQRLGPGDRLPHTGKPDVDNLAKAVMDVLARSKIVRDDALFWRVDAEKYYAPSAGRTGCLIIVTTSTP